MKIYQDFKPSDTLCSLKTSLTLGTFDGVHTGHRQILKRVAEKSKETNTQSCVLTFDRHPLTILKPKLSQKILTTLDEKVDIFEKLGIEITVIVAFTINIAKMSAGEFIEDYLVKCLGVQCFIAGYDHGFGKNRSLTPEELVHYSRKYEFNLDIVPPVHVNGVIVKSSIIRDYIIDGRVELAAEFLSEHYSFSGCVVRGRGLGTKIGFPTANLIPIHGEKIIPPAGVYFGMVEIEGIHMKCVITISSKPTFGISDESIEIHIPNYTNNLYEKILRISFIRRLRNIVQFPTETALIQQIRKDIEEIKLV